MYTCYSRKIGFLFLHCDYMEQVEAGPADKGRMNQMDQGILKQPKLWSMMVFVRGFGPMEGEDKYLGNRWVTGAWTVGSNC